MYRVVFREDKSCSAVLSVEIFLRGIGDDCEEGISGRRLELVLAILLTSLLYSLYFLSLFISSRIAWCQVILRDEEKKEFDTFWEDLMFKQPASAGLMNELSGMCVRDGWTGGRRECSHQKDRWIESETTPGHGNGI